MHRFRFSVKTFLIGVGFLAAVFGVLESHSRLVWSLVWTLNLGLLAFTLLGAWTARGNTQVFCRGYAVFGGLYSLVAFGMLFPTPPNYGNLMFGYSRSNERPELFTSRLLNLYASMRASRSIGDRVMAQWSGGGFWPSVIVEYRDGRYLVDWDDSSPNEWVSASQIQPYGQDLEQVGHSLFSILLGLLGGLTALCCFGTPDAPPPASRKLPDDTEVARTGSGGTE